MAIPLSYNLRNLAVRRTTTIMTAMGIALPVLILMAVFAMVDGLASLLSVTGNPLHVLVLRKGATAELNSGISRETWQNLRFTPGIAKAKNGEPLEIGRASCR